MPIPETAKLVISRIAARMFPTLERDIETGAQTGRHVRLKRWIAQARLQEALRSDSETEISDALMSHWRSEGANAYYDQYPDRFENWFLGPHQVIIDELVRLGAESPFRQLVEIGCGDGQVLAHCAARLPQVADLIGVDINPAIIARNSLIHSADPRLRFLAGNAEGWLPDHTGPNTVLLSYGGVMEYFSRESLAAIFADLARKPGAAVALVEPVDPDHDLDHDPRSHTFGQEQSFSHNHAALLTEAGFDIRYKTETFLSKIRWIMILTHAIDQSTPERAKDDMAFTSA